MHKNAIRAKSVKATGPRITIGSKIKEIRESKKISRKELSNITGIAASTIANYENGHRSPAPKALINISEALDVPLTELFDLNENAHLELLREAINRDMSSEHEPDIEDYIKLLNKKQLTYNLAYADLNASTDANRNIVKYLLLNSMENNFNYEDLSSDEIDSIFEFASLAIETKAKEIIKNRELIKLREEYEQVKISRNIKHIIRCTLPADADLNDMAKAKRQINDVLHEVLFYLDKNDASDEVIDTISDLIDGIEY